jgi:hypothetical protein
MPAGNLVPLGAGGELLACLGSQIGYGHVGHTPAAFLEARFPVTFDRSHRELGSGSCRVRRDDAASIGRGSSATPAEKPLTQKDPPQMTQDAIHKRAPESLQVR